MFQGCCTAAFDPHLTFRYIIFTSTTLTAVTMTTGGCCHLPGSLCDCASSPGVWKSVEEGGADGCQALYVTQVTALDGRLLSSVLKPTATPRSAPFSGTDRRFCDAAAFTLCLSLRPCSDGPICRICHEGGHGEGLLSPCDCTGTLGAVHKSCLEMWLSSSNTSYCELCHREFSIERRPRPLTEVTKVNAACWFCISL